MTNTEGMLLVFAFIQMFFLGLIALAARDIKELLDKRFSAYFDARDRERERKLERGL